MDVFKSGPGGWGSGGLRSSAGMVMPKSPEYSFADVAGKSGRRMSSMKGLRNKAKGAYKTLKKSLGRKNKSELREKLIGGRRRRRTNKLNKKKRTKRRTKKARRTRRTRRR